MSTAAVSDTDTIEHLDFQPACECWWNHNDHCANPADWMLSLICGCTVLICTAHWQALNRWDAAGTHKFGCGICDAGVWDLLLDIVTNIRRVR